MLLLANWVLPSWQTGVKEAVIVQGPFIALQPTNLQIWTLFKALCHLQISVPSEVWQGGNAAFIKKTPSLCKTDNNHNHISSTVQLDQINVWRVLLGSSLFPLSGSQDHFLPIYLEHWARWLFRALQRPSKEPDTWGETRTGDYRISNFSTRAVFHLSVAEQ